MLQQEFLTRVECTRLMAASPHEQERFSYPAGTVANQLERTLATRAAASTPPAFPTKQAPAVGRVPRGLGNETETQVAIDGEYERTVRGELLRRIQSSEGRHDPTEVREAALEFSSADSVCGLLQALQGKAKVTTSPGVSERERSVSRVVQPREAGRLLAEAFSIERDQAMVLETREDELVRARGLFERGRHSAEAFSALPRRDANVGARILEAARRRALGSLVQAADASLGALLSFRELCARPVPPPCVANEYPTRRRLHRSQATPSSINVVGAAGFDPYALAPADRSPG